MSELFPKDVKKLWNKWEIRSMVLFSLCLQILLILLGNRRKYTTKTLIRGVIWIAYLCADSVATVSLGIILSKTNSSSDKYPQPNGAIMAFWAPFLLVHLGGPDTITAYSLEDNELWLRHLLGLIFQVGVAFYIFLHSWGSNPLTYLAIPVFITGIFKYGERTWVLWSASNEHFRNSLLPAPFAGPNYAKVMESHVAQQLPMSNHRIHEHNILVQKEAIQAALYLHGIDNESTTNELLDGYNFFSICKFLYADLVIGLHERQDSIAKLRNKSFDYAFKLIEIELGILYDVLYSKASIAHSIPGTFLRSVSFLSFVSVFVAFQTAVHKHSYGDIDVTITYLLLGGAIFIEIYAGIMLIFSERTLIYLSKHKKAGMGNFIYRVMSSTLSASIDRHRWSASMAQYNLIDFCLKEKPVKCERILKIFQIFETLEKFQNKTRKKVTLDLKYFIFQLLKQKSDQTISHPKDLKDLCCKRGDYALQKYNCLDKLNWSVLEVEFDHSILLWHIATDLCYYSDHKMNGNGTPSLNCKISKSLSDYMLYLLVIRPLMLPKGIGEIRYRDTCAETKRFFQEKRETRRSEACSLLLLVNTGIPPSEVKGDRSKSVLFDGCRLAKSLQALETEDPWTTEKKWDMIAEVWIEMLCYAAIQCKWSHHGQQLSSGGELLTHVCLLMAHLGLSELFQIFKGSTIQD